MIIGVLQARFSSSRLYGKVLKPIVGKPMLALQIERIQRSKLLDRLIVATSNIDDDQPIASLCIDMGVEYFRGNLSDVLDRFYQASKLYSPQHVVRLTGDCPLCDPQLIDALIQFHLNGGYDYSSNTIAPTYPDGLDVEAFSFSCLKTAHQEGRLPSHREHVTPFIHQQPQRFKLGNYKNDTDLSSLRWTVDEQLDLDLITKIYESLYPSNPEFTTKDILTWLQAYPEWKIYNTQVQRNEGLTKSLLADRSFVLSQF
jgi:spore coat polysaccharide biosynthesis protein SpsF